MSDHLKHKVTQVLGLLREHDYCVPSTGVKIPGDSQAVVVSLINALRAARRINVQMHAPNLSTYLSHPDEAPPSFMRELTHATGLSDLGFDETVWEHDDVLEQVHSAIKGGVLTTIVAHPNNHALLEFHPHEILKGFDFSDDAASKAMPRFHSIPEFTIPGGTHLNAAAFMPFDGYLRVIANQDGEFVALNDYLHAPNDHLRAGRHILKTVPTDPTVPRTFVFAFASAEWVFGKWPTHHDKKSRLSHGAFHQLVKTFFASPHEYSSSVQSFITTVPAHA